MADPQDSRLSVQIRGHVIESTTAGGAQHIEMLSQE
jgi:hypothetical protein